MYVWIGPRVIQIQVQITLILCHIILASLSINYRFLVLCIFLSFNWTHSLKPIDSKWPYHTDFVLCRTCILCYCENNREKIRKKKKTCNQQQLYCAKRFKYWSKRIASFSATFKANSSFWLFCLQLQFFFFSLAIRSVCVCVFFLFMYKIASLLIAKWLLMMFVVRALKDC